MLPEAEGPGQHFQARGHSFSLYGPTLSRQITYLFISCYKLAYKWVYAPGGGGVLPYLGYTGTCRWIGYGFLASLS